MDRAFFLAANSGGGFRSLYDGFPPEGVFLHIIKGGPGTGKSSFMRRIRAAAEERGLDTETVLCSGDPEGKMSLLLDHAGVDRDVSDPWYTGDFDATWTDILAGCTAILKSMDGL